MLNAYTVSALAMPLTPDPYGAAARELYDMVLAHPATDRQLVSMYFFGSLTCLVGVVNNVREFVVGIGV